MRKILPVNGGGVSGGGTPQVQSDWAEANPGAVDYIKNKPIIPTPVPVPDWISLGPDIPPTIADPLDDEFSGAAGSRDAKWLFGGGATANALMNCDGRGNLFTRANVLGTATTGIMLQAKPAPPYAFVIKLHYSTGFTGTTSNQYLALCVRDSAAGNVNTFQMSWTGATTNRWELIRWQIPNINAAFTFNSTTVSGVPWFTAFQWYLKLYDDGVNLNYLLSQDGLTYFNPVNPIARASWVPGGGNQIGIFFGNDSGRDGGWYVEYFRRVL